MLVEENGELERKDISAENWDGPPENCIGWWKSKVPDLEKGRVFWVPKEILLSVFYHLTETGKDPDKTYVMAILLMQKKHLRLLETIDSEEGQCMWLADNTTGEKYEVAIRSMDDSQVQAVQDDLVEKLFTDIAPTNDPPID